MHRGRRQETQHGRQRGAEHGARAPLGVDVEQDFDDNGMIVSDHSYSIDPVGAAEQDPRG